jgi:hypothetical protein
MKEYGRVDVYIHAFLTLAIVGGERSASLPGHITPRERAPVPIGKEAGWASEPVWTMRTKNSCPYLDLNSNPGNLNSFMCYVCYSSLSQIDWFSFTCKQVQGLLGPQLLVSRTQMGVPGMQQNNGYFGL